MTRRCRWQAAACLCIAASGCADALGGGAPEPVRLRVQNQSVLPFDIVTLATLDGRKTWLDVGTGDTTAYVDVSGAYGIVSTEVVLGADTLRLQAIDHVGEEYLEAGDYTFLLNVSGPYGEFPSLIQVLRRDQ